MSFLPEFWDPVGGSIRQAPLYRDGTHGSALRLDLERYEAVFVVVNASATPQPHVTATDADAVHRTRGGKVALHKYSPGTIHYSTTAGKEHSWDTPARELTPIAVSDRWTRTAVDGNAAIYRAHFDAPGIKTAELRISGMTQVISRHTDGCDL